MNDLEFVLKRIERMSCRSHGDNHPKCDICNLILLRDHITKELTPLLSDCHALLFNGIKRELVARLAAALEKTGDL